MDELAFIKEFLERNGDYVREKYAARSRVTMTVKSNAADLLTEADLTVQQRAADALAEAYPDDGFVAEEGEQAAYPEDPNARCWVMDPIDGTNNFVRGLFPCFGIALAFVDQGIVQAGGVLLPITGDLFLGARGQGSTLNGSPIRVSDVQDLAAAKVEVEFGWVTERQLTLERGGALIQAAGQVRCSGSAVAGLCQVACGEMDGYMHVTLKPWDYAAAQVILEEAGGVASRLDGKELRLFDGKQGLLMSNGAIHEAMRACLRHSQ